MSYFSLTHELSLATFRLPDVHTSETNRPTRSCVCVDSLERVACDAFVTLHFLDVSRCWRLKLFHPHWRIFVCSLARLRAQTANYCILAGSCAYSHRDCWSGHSH